MSILTSRLLPYIVQRAQDRTPISSCITYCADLSLCSQETNAIGPGIGPAAAPASLTGLPPAPASLPTPPQASGSGSYSAATISSGPQPASMYPGQPTPVMLPPLHYQGMDAAQPFGYQPAPPGSATSPPGMHPSRIAALAAGGPMGTPPHAGMVRNADEMEGTGDIPPAKRQKVAKLPGGQYYPEADWISMHPVNPSFYREFAAKERLTPVP